MSYTYFCLCAQLTLLVRSERAHTVETLSCTTITSGTSAFRNTEFLIKVWIGK